MKKFHVNICTSQSNKTNLFFFKKKTNAPSECTIFIAFPLKQWLHERAWMLRHMYIAILVIKLTGHTTQKHTYNALSRFHGNNGFGNVSQCYVIFTLPILCFYIILIPSSKSMSTRVPFQLFMFHDYKNSLLAPFFTVYSSSRTKLRECVLFCSVFYTSLK